MRVTLKSADMLEFATKWGETPHAVSKIQEMTYGSVSTKKKLQHLQVLTPFWSENMQDTVQIREEPYHRLKEIVRRYVDPKNMEQPCQK